MTPGSRRMALLLAILAALPTEACAGGFFGRAAEGWWFYNEALPEAEPEVPELPPPSTAPTPEPPKEAEPPKAAKEPGGPAPFSAAWLRVEVPKAMERAIDDPTDENIRAYAYLQRLVMDKASKFGARAQRVIMADPLVDESMRRPRSSFAVQAVDFTAAQNVQATLKRIAESTGLLFFFRGDCPYCSAQAPLIQALSRQFGFRILPVSLDGQGLPNGEFPEFKPDQGQAVTMGVEQVPAVFMMRPPDGVAAVAQGLVSLEELQQRILLAAVNAGFLSEDELRGTRAAVPMPNLADRLPTAPGAEVDPQDPAALVDYIRRRVRTRTGG